MRSKSGEIFFYYLQKGLDLHCFNTAILLLILAHLQSEYFSINTKDYSLYF